MAKFTSSEYHLTIRQHGTCSLAPPDSPARGDVPTMYHAIGE
jgi:hypothetical protein